MSIADGRRLKETAEPAATRRIGLQNVDRAGIKHPPKIIAIVPIFACCNFHLRGRMLSNEMQSFEIIR